MSATRRATRCPAPPPSRLPSLSSALESAGRSRRILPHGSSSEMIQRRLYIYIVAAASIAMVLIGLINLGSTALNQILNATPPYSNVRDAYAGFGPVILVGLPAWGIHCWLAHPFPP